MMTAKTGFPVVPKYCHSTVPYVIKTVKISFQHRCCFKNNWFDYPNLNSLLLTGQQTDNWLHYSKKSLLSLSGFFNLATQQKPLSLLLIVGYRIR
jgi:hypothetical protein